MRQASVIRELSPCDSDYTDNSLQTISDAKAKGPVYCDNLKQCQKRSKSENLQCCRRVAQQMAPYILSNKKSFWDAVEQEKKDFLKMGHEGRFWVFRDGKWQVVKGKKNVVEDIIKFALIMIDRKEDERRPFTEDGMKKPELGPEDTFHNAMLDLDDVYAEVGQKNPYRR